MPLQPDRVHDHEGQQLDLRPDQGQRRCRKGKFGGGKPREMQVNLLLDQSLPNDGMSVKDITDKLFKMMEAPTGGGGGGAGLGPAARHVPVGRDDPVQGGLHVADRRLPALQAQRHADPRRRQARAHAGRDRPASASSTSRQGKTHEPDDALGRRARRARRQGRRHAASRSPTSTYGDPNRWRLIAEANGIDNPLHLRRGTPLNLPAARLMPAPPSTSPPRRSRSTASGSTRRRWTTSRRSRCATSSGCPDMATDPHGRPGGRRHIADAAAPSRSATRSRSGSATIDAPSPSRSSRARSSRSSRSSRRSAAMICVRAYDQSHRLQRNRRSAHVPGHDASDVVRKVVGRRRLQAGTIETHHDRPQVPAAEHGDATSTSQAARRRWRTASSASTRGQGASCAAQRNGDGAVPELAWRENADLVQAAHERVPAARHGQGHAATTRRPSRRSSARPRTPTAIPRPRRTARDKAQEVRRAPSCSSPTASPTPPTRPSRSRRARSTSSPAAPSRPRASMTGNPHRQGRRQDQARGLRAASTASTSLTLGHARLRPRRLPHPLRDQRPQPAHADRRDAAEGRARLGRSGLVIGLVTNIKDPESARAACACKFPRSATAIEGTWARVALPGAGQGRAACLHARDRRRGRRRLRARRHAPARRARLAAQRRSTSRTTKMRGDQDGGSLVIYGRKDAEIKLGEAARDRRQGAHDDHVKVESAARTARATTRSVEVDGSKFEVKAGSHDQDSRAPGEPDDQEHRPASPSRRPAPLKLKGATVDIEASGDA